VAVTLTILGSGSRGNAAVVASSRTRILIDAGFRRREMLRRLQAVGQAPEELSAVLITHEHSDHVAGLDRLAAKLPLAVYLNEGTRAALGKMGESLERVETFVSGESFTVGDIEVTPFTIPHDAADPVGFRLCAEGVRLVVVTDLGYLAENVKDQLQGADCAVLESNHDTEMLKNGGYPWALKQRVASRVGHLSNETVAMYLGGDFDGVPAHLILAHLSENNNLPELALLAAQRALANRGCATALHIAAQDAPLATLTF